MTRCSGILFLLLTALPALGQGGDAQLRAKADALFTEGRYAEAMPHYAQLVSLEPNDRDLNYRLGTCIIHGGEDKDKAVGFLKYAVEDPSVPPMAWYQLGRAYHLTYRFDKALEAYQRYRGVADRKTLADRPVDALEQQCRNGKGLLGNIKDVAVHGKVEVAESEFFRFYDLQGIGGRIVVLPEELKSNLDKKSGERSLVYLPDQPGPFYFSSYGKDGRTGRDIYRTELLPDGSFATPVKLAGYVNTDLDEDFPFMHPDGRQFYFSSKGHNSMGGYDVFRCTHDPGLDVFGPPENLDFAVNTPDDDIFYLVDGQGTQACFASGRDSRQDMIHVYRVSTTQVPVTITVLKGTFSSAFDPGDRQAHIVVEDGVTRERIAELDTDIDGGYLVALPRTGKFRFLVKAGPSGKTHAGMVDVPRSSSPRAYRQELQLVQKDGREQLVIRNYFDDPLDDDILALAMDEIRRRAKLDVNASERQEVAAEDTPPADVMTAAGFTGDKTLADAVRMAEEQSAATDREAFDLADRSGQAVTLALEATAEAEAAGRRASDLVEQAAARQDDPAAEDLLMQAALERRIAREATLRARAAMATATDLDTERMAATQRAAKERKLSEDLSALVSAGREEEALPLLRTLREQQERAGSAEGSVALEERFRRQASEREQEAARAMASVTAKSSEESELAGRIARLERERKDAKRSRAEELDREIAEGRATLAVMRDELGDAKARALALERETRIARGEADLVDRLANGQVTVAASELQRDQLEALQGRLQRTSGQLDELAIDQRFDLAVEERLAGTDPSTFDWQLDAAGALQAGMPATATLTMPRDRSGDATALATRTSDTDAAVGTPREARSSGADGGAGDQGAQEQPVAGQDLSASDLEGEELVSAAVAVPVPDAEERSVQEEGGAAVEAAATPESGSADPDRLEAGRPAESTTGEGRPSSAEQERFLLENELAELTQLRTATRDEDERARLDTRIAETRAGIAELDRRDAEQAAEQAEAIEAIATEALERTTPQGGEATAFSTDLGESELLELISPAYDDDKARIATLPDAQQRAEGLHGLELILVDSIQTETTRQLALLEAEPGRAEEVLPRVDRLRQLKQQHLREAERQLLVARGERPAGTTTEMAAAEVPDRSPTRVRTDDAAPAAGRFVTLHADPQAVYESTLVHRSDEVAEAVAMQQRDIAAMALLTGEIDSLEHVLDTIAAGRDYDRLRRQTDRLIDDRLILRTDLGQRLEYIAREEYKLATDSLKRVQAQVATRGLAPDEPLVVMATRAREDAGRRIDAAKGMRKQADRSDDILLRDSLFRQAYGLELQALADMDRAITVNNYILSDAFVPGSGPTYAAIEESLFGVPVQQLAAKEESTTGASGEALETADAREPSGVRDDPRSHFGTFLAAEEAQGAGGMVPYELDDPTFFSRRMEQALATSRDLEQRSLELGDRALALRDSVNTVRRKDREDVQQLATRTQLRSDSLHALSLAYADSARMYEQRGRDAEEQRDLKRRLMQFYYLSEEEQALVINDRDLSRYFQARSRSLEQLDQVAEAEREAVASRELSDLMLQRAGAVMATDGTGRQPTAQELQRAASFNDQAVRLRQRADSLDRVAARLRGAADLNDGQAAAMLQTLAPDRAEELQALEMRTRRTEPMLAEARALQGGPEETDGTGTAGEDTPVEAPRELASATGTEAAGTPPPAELPRQARPAGTGRVVPGWDFPMPDELVEDLFVLRPGTGSREAEIPMDLEMPEGLVYKVQIGAFRNPVPKDLFADMTPVMGESAGGGLVRYTAGLFTGFEGADRAKQQVRDRGYRDAFVVAYLDGKRIPLAEARALDAGAAPELAGMPAAGPVAEAVPVTRPSQVDRPGQVAAAAAEQVAPGEPASAEEVLAAFDREPKRSDYYTDPSAAPARQVEAVKGLFFTVQVGVYSKPVALDKLYNIDPLNTELIEGGRIRYTTGVYRSLEDARARRTESVGQGVSDAFITAYLNGKRIPVAEARDLLDRFGASVLVDPSLATP